MNDRELTDDTDREIVEYVRAFREKHGHGPTDAEGAARFGWGSGWAFGSRVKKLVRRGHLTRGDEHRSLAVAGQSGGLSVPLIGVCAAGAPLPPGDGNERLEFRELFGDGLVALKIKGTSMIEAHIQDGDWILIRRNPDPDSGEKVVMNIDGELTLKTFRRVKRASGSEIWLYPCNREMKAVRLSELSECFVVGILAGVIRKS